MSKKKTEEIIYHLEVYCVVNKYGAVIPTGGSEGITDEYGEPLDMLKYPKPRDIIQIWEGEKLKYPLTLKK